MYRTLKALLDTNIIIHRENLQATNYSIGLLFKWLDKLHYEKLVHPYSLQELRKANNSTQQEIYNARLAAYVEMKSTAPQSRAFLDLLSDTPKQITTELTTNFCVRFIQAVLIY